jgi:hypothetical protein
VRLLAIAFFCPARDGWQIALCRDHFDACDFGAVTHKLWYVLYYATLCVTARIQLRLSLSLSLSLVLVRVNSRAEDLSRSQLSSRVESSEGILASSKLTWVLCSKWI